jgi:hypothetical protein
MMRPPILVAVATFGTTILLTASIASAFGGVYVSSSEGEAHSEAAMVSLFRDGKRTVVTIQSNYVGPPEDFSLLVPVPTPMNEQQVKTLPNRVFEGLDTVSAPRIVEYRERDPCYAARQPEVITQIGSRPQRVGPPKRRRYPDRDVRVESAFTLDEYDIVVLNADASSALTTWLEEQGYTLPDRAAEMLEPYIRKGHHFFVARVKMDALDYTDGRAVLPPIRFHYESDDFTLPVRPGLLNSKGPQELIVFTLARDQRYRVANYPNVTIPTNIPVHAKTKEHFGSFYRELFANVLAENPQAVVTEYAWSIESCDACPTTKLQPKEVLALGGDLLPNADSYTKALEDYEKGKLPEHPGPVLGSDWVLTRLHTRYSEHTLGADLAFEPAPAIRGGVGRPEGKQGQLGGQGPTSAGENRFQGRYVIRRPWDGEVECDEPEWGVWRGPDGQYRPTVEAAEGIAFSREGGRHGLATYIDGETRVEGLAQPVSAYDKPVGDVLAEWGPTGGDGSAALEESPPPGGCLSSGGEGRGTAGIVLPMLLGFVAARRDAR